MLICIPMAGRSSRFAAAGYEQPKYLLDLWGRPVFDHALASFSAYATEARFVFCLLDQPGVGEFVEARTGLLGIRDVALARFSDVTRGQAETVTRGLEMANIGSNEAPLVIFNIDSIRPRFSLTERYIDHSYLEVFRGEGDGWSFVEEDSTRPGFARSVREKSRISPWCSNGLYVFRDVATFRKAYAAECTAPSQIINEHYIAPIYNQLIARGERIGMHKLKPDDTLFSGTPTEYEQLRRSTSPYGDQL